MRWNLASLVVAAVGLVGCDSPTRVAPASSSASSAAPVAAKPTPGRVWFIKTIGPTEPAPAGSTPAIANWQPIAEIQDSFMFAADGTPTWKVPAEWSQKTIVDKRSYELVHPSGTRIEISSATLADVARDDVIKTRLNIWRDDVGLAPVPDDQWDDVLVSGMNRSTASGRTVYSFQFGKVPAEGTKTTILGTAIPHPDPATIK
jgi:hypothetical protein